MSLMGSGKFEDMRNVVFEMSLSVIKDNFFDFEFS